MAQVIKRCGCERSRWSKGSHSWTARWWEDGKQREKSFRRNHSEAVKFSKLIEAEKLSVHRGDPPLPITFKQYAETWLAAGPGAAGTVRIYTQAMRTYLLPRFGDRQLAAVAAAREAVGEFLRTLTPPAARIAMTALQSMLGEAARAGRIESHRLGGVKLPEYQPAVPFNFPTHAQFTKLASGLPPELQPAVWIMRGCGLRPGECLGLRKEDFSGGLPAGVPPAGGQWQRRPGAAQGAQAGEFRDVPLPGYVKAVVDGLGDGDLFAISTRGFNKAFAKAAKVAGLDGFRPHDLSLSFNPCVRVGP